MQSIRTKCCLGGTLVGGNGGLKALGLCDQGTTPINQIPLAECITVKEENFNLA